MVLLPCVHKLALIVEIIADSTDLIDGDLLQALRGRLASDLGRNSRDEVTGRYRREVRDPRPGQAVSQQPHCVLERREAVVVDVETRDNRHSQLLPCGRCFRRHWHSITSRPHLCPEAKMETEALLAGEAETDPGVR